MSDLTRIYFVAIGEDANEHRAFASLAAVDRSITKTAALYRRRLSLIENAVEGPHGRIWRIVDDGETIGTVYQIELHTVNTAGFLL